MTLDPEGQVTEAEVRSGDSPWAEALMQALRTWRFVARAADRCSRSRPTSSPQGASAARGAG